MQIYRLVLGFIMGMLLAFTPSAMAGQSAHRPYVDDEVLVKYRTDTAAQQSVRYQSVWRLATVRSFEKSGIHQVKLPAGMSVDQAVALYRSDPDVLYAEPNYRYRLQGLSNDAMMDRLWGLHNSGQVVNGTSGTVDADLDADLAWDLTTGDGDTVVAVVDSGVDLNHPDLQANLWTNADEIADNGLDDDGNGYVDDVHGWDFVDDDNLPMDSHGHGTHVAGIIGAVGDNAEGVSGVCWRVSIMPLRFIASSDYGTTADAIKAIEYADDKGADIINLSWGGSGFSQALKDAIEAADALVVCAAGNGSSDLDDTPLYPAALDSGNILSVAASNADDDPAWFTNYSTTRVDVAAPGTNILSTVPDRQTLFTDDFSTADNWTFDGAGTSWVVETTGGGLPVLTESPMGVDYAGSLNIRASINAPMDFSDRSGVRMDFQIIGETADRGDGLYVEASTDQTNWTQLMVGLADDGPVSMVTGSLPAWQWAVVDLGAFDGQEAVYLRLRFVSDTVGTAGGYLLADLSVTGADTTHPAGAYAYYQGTSMSTAYASGTAALVKSQRPSLTPDQLKLILETSVDRKAQLADTVASSGRINAHRALQSVATVDLTAQALDANRVSLNWTLPETTSTGFAIQRRTEAMNDFVTIADVGADDIAYIDTGLTADTAYTYRILTLEGAIPTGYSDESSAIPQRSDAAVQPGDAQGDGGGGGGCFIMTMIGAGTDGG